MDLVFDRTAEGHVIKCLTIVDDATHEAVAIEVERAISGHMLTRVLYGARWGRVQPCPHERTNYAVGGITPHVQSRSDAAMYRHCP